MCNFKTSVVLQLALRLIRDMYKWWGHILRWVIVTSPSVSMKCYSIDKSGIVTACLIQSQLLLILSLYLYTVPPAMCHTRTTVQFAVSYFTVSPVDLWIHFLKIIVAVEQQLIFKYPIWFDIFAPSLTAANGVKYLCLFYYIQELVWAINTAPQGHL